MRNGRRYARLTEPAVTIRAFIDLSSSSSILISLRPAGCEVNDCTPSCSKCSLSQTQGRDNKVQLPSPNHCASRDFLLVFKNLSQTQFAHVPRARVPRRIQKSLCTPSAPSALSLSIQQHISLSLSPLSIPVGTPVGVPDDGIENLSCLQCRRRVPRPLALPQTAD